MDINLSCTNKMMMNVTVIHMDIQ